jgi:hypothetical protein
MVTAALVFSEAPSTFAFRGRGCRQPTCAPLWSHELGDVGADDFAERTSTMPRRERYHCARRVHQVDIARAILVGVDEPLRGVECEHRTGCIQSYPVGASSNGTRVGRTRICPLTRS